MKDRLTQYVIPGRSAQRSFYVSRDDGPGMLFLNGLYHSHAAWLHQRRCKEFTGFRQIFVDYRGVGGSRLQEDADFTFDDVVDDIAAILAELRVERVVVVGFSMGGMVALRLVDRYPASAAGLVMLNSGPRVKLQVQNMVAGAVELLKRGGDMRPLLKMLYSWNHSERYLDKVRSVESEILDNYSRYNADIGAFVRLITAFGKKPDLLACCRAIRAPMLVIGSDGDEVFPLELQREVVTNVPGARLEIAVGCGHSSFVESPEVINGRIASFLKEVVRP
jgi:pimeloyl-ACP methyl ester carboxylesterase